MKKDKFFAETQPVLTAELQNSDPFTKPTNGANGPNGHNGFNSSLVPEVGKAIVSYRLQKLHLSQRDFADRVGISRSALQRIENGDSHEYSIGFLEKILSYLGIGLWDLVGRAFLTQKGYVLQGSLKGEFDIRYPEDGLRIVSLIPRREDFFCGFFELGPQRTIPECKLPSANYVLFQGFRGKFVFRLDEKEYLLTEERHLLFKYPALPLEIYNPDQIRESICLLFTLPSFL